MMLAIIGGAPSRFAPYADLYRRALTELGKEPLPIGVHSPGFVGDRRPGGPRACCSRTSRPTATASAPSGAGARPRGSSSRPRPTTARCSSARPRRSPQKIARTVKELGISRFDLKYSNGTLPHEDLMETIRALRHRGRSRASASCWRRYAQLRAEPALYVAKSAFQSPYPLSSVIHRSVPVYSTTSPRLVCCRARRRCPWTCRCSRARRWRSPASRPTRARRG